MASQGQALQQYVQELAATMEDMRNKSVALGNQIRQEEFEKANCEKELG